MSYQVLARKYRPQNFDEVVGQEHVTQTLKNAIKKKRLHHAYLFTGVRGTGKTSLARILAMCLNVEDGPSADPDPNSPNCQAIAKGQFLDVIEIDGASNTSVENVRELREQVKYMPAAGKYKVYIIDEVHMLSTSAFNALLKTLEEPPPHVLFIFATTEAHKIPVTILSRCQRFDLKRLSQDQILGRLKEICKLEKVAFDPGSLELLARSAEGSMRDAQSLLDMAISLCGNKLATDTIREMLGLVEATWIRDLTDDCLHGKTQEALAKVGEIYSRGYDLRQAALQWVDYLHDLTLLKAAGSGALSDAVTADQLSGMEEAIAKVDLDDLQVATQTIYRSAEQIHRSESPKILFDLLVVRLVHGNPFQSLASVMNGETPKISNPRSEKTAPKVQADRLSTAAGSQEEKAPPPLSPVKKNTPDNTGGELLTRALKNRPQIKAILDHAAGQYWEGEQYVVAFEEGSMWVDMFSDKRSPLAEALSKELGKEVQVVIQEVSPGFTPASTDGEAPGPEIPDDPLVRQAVEILGASVKEVKRL